jgi:hypothetical protein
VGDFSDGGELGGLSAFAALDMTDSTSDDEPASILWQIIIDICVVFLVGIVSS